MVVVGTGGGRKGDAVSVGEDEKVLERVLVMATQHCDVLTGY